MTPKDAWELVGGLADTSKMPWYSYSIPASHCNAGQKLRKEKCSTCAHCYACKGMYTFPVVKAALERRYKSLDDPRWVDAMTTLLLAKSKGKERYFRWHDSGDLRDEKHFAMIWNVAYQTPNIQHWLPTRESAMVHKAIWDSGSGVPENLTIRYSMYYLDQFPPKPKYEVDHEYSASFTDTAKVPKWVHVCPAPTQGGKCVTCRACWKQSVKCVAYHLH